MYLVRVGGDEYRVDFLGVMYNRGMVYITCIKRYVFDLKKGVFASNFRVVQEELNAVRTVAIRWSEMLLSTY